MRHTIRILLCSAVFGATSFSVCPGLAGTREASRLPAHVEIPFKLYAGYLVVVEGRIGPLSRLKFVLDTGASHSVVSREIADKLRVSRRPGRVIGACEAVATQWAVVPSMEFGAIHALDTSVLVDELGYFRPFSTQVDAVIGLDLLRQRSFSIDFRSKTVTFGPIEGESSGVPMKSDAACLSVEVKIEDRPVPVIVDTGIRGLLLYEGRLRQQPALSKLTAFSIGGALQSKLAMLRARLGSTDIDPRVLLVPAPADSVLSGLDGFLGVSSLEARRVDFDFEHGTLRWKK
jgi:gag-polyprotein putative aspartyl protease